jgi:site-specific DNA-methyltransferase (adenine-specific)
VKPYYKHGGIRIYHGDCREVLPQLPSGTVALAVTDPPYRSLDSHVRRGTTTRLVGGSRPGTGSHPDSAWFPTLGEAEVLAVLATTEGLLAADGALYVFADVKTGLRLFPSLLPSNVLIWDKGRIGMGYSWRRMHEWIAYCPQPGHRLRDRGLGDIVRCSLPRKKQHPTEKPIAVLATLIRNSTDPGDLVIDPFMGSGTTLLAAAAMGRRAIGIETEKRYCRIAAERLASESASEMLEPRRSTRSSMSVLLMTSKTERAVS